LRRSIKRQLNKEVSVVDEDVAVDAVSVRTTMAEARDLKLRLSPVTR